MTPSLIARLDWRFHMWRWRVRDLWANRREILADKWNRCRGCRMYSWRPIEFSDGENGQASQQHMLCVSRGMFGWQDTGIIVHWSRLARDGAETRFYRFGGNVFETLSDALTTYEATRDKELAQ